MAVIGDGALTGGVALEALNHIGQVKQRLIIVLNDNKMSISPNVGGISRHLNYLVSGRPYIRLKEVIQKFLKSIPGVGRPLFELAKKVEVLMRTMMVPGSLFDELGIKYIGPVNGHDYREMQKEFAAAKKYDFPVLLHVVTQQGAGLRARLRGSQFLPFFGAVQHRERQVPRPRKGPLLFGDLRPHRAAPGRRGPAFRRPHRGHARGHGPGCRAERFPGKFLRRRHRRAVHVRFRRRPGAGRLQARAGRLFHFPAARHGPGHPRRLADGPAAPGRHRPRRAGRRGRPDPPGHLRHRPAAPRPRHRAHGAQG